LYRLAAAVWLGLAAAFAVGRARRPAILAGRARRHVGRSVPIADPAGRMMLSLGLARHSPGPGRILFAVFFAITLVLAACLSAARLDADGLNSTHLLPTAGRGLIAAGGLRCARRPPRARLDDLRHRHLGVAVARLGYAQSSAGAPAAAAAAGGTLAIDMAVPAVAGWAYFELSRGRISPFAYALAGYAALLVMVQTSV
jgi:tellurite resistance protein